MKYITLILLGLLLTSCKNDNTKDTSHQDILPIRIYIEVKFQDNTIDTLYHTYYNLGDDFLQGRPKAFLNDNACLQVGYQSIIASSMTNLACDLKSFRTLYMVTKQNDTIQ